MSRNSIDYNLALSNPPAVFEAPECVLSDPRLDREGKRAILKSWAAEANEVACRANKINENSSMLRRILKALEMIGDYDPPVTVSQRFHRRRLPWSIWGRSF